MGGGGGISTSGHAIEFADIIVSRIAYVADRHFVSVSQSLPGVADTRATVLLHGILFQHACHQNSRSALYSSTIDDCINVKKHSLYTC